MAREKTEPQNNQEAVPLPFVPESGGNPINISALIQVEVDKRFAAIEAETKAKEKSAKAKKKCTYTGPDPNELVKIKLAFDKQNVDPLHVRLNNYVKNIPRGKEFQVPLYVAMHIAECEQQDLNRILLVNGLVDDYEKKAAAFGIT